MYLLNIPQHGGPAPVEGHSSTEAQGEAGHKLDPLEPSFGLTFWSGVTFMCLLLLLLKFAWKPIVKMVEDREKKIRGDIDGAEKARAEADAALKKYQAQLDEAAVKARETVEAARARAEQAAAEIAAVAKTEAEGIIVRARAQIEAEKQKALADIKASVVELSMAITREVVKRTASQEDHAAIAGDLIQRMKDVA